MNSDPYDSAAWRSLGMLDDEENSLFDEAMRQDPGLRRACEEMDRLAAAIAATACAPAVPQPAELDRLRRSIGLPHAGRKAPLWLAVSGWTLAAALAAWLVRGMLVAPATPPPAAAQDEAPAAAASAPAEVEDQPRMIRRLSQEIGDLRGRLAEFQQREQEFYQIIPGRSLQVVMKMLPPDTAADDRSALVTPAMLGDALAALFAPPLPPDDHDGTAEETAGELPVQPVAVPEPAPAPEPPLAIPIYDAIRDTGTLVILNLPPAGGENAYHLWVTTNQSPQPVFIGSLPDSSGSGTDAFDFSLRSSMILPTGFMLTHGAADAPSAPDAGNTVLAGPPQTR